MDGVLSPWRKVCQGVGWTRRDETKRERERERERMGGYRKPSVRPMPRRLYRFTTERRTSVNRYLLTVDFPWPRRNQPNSPLLSSPLLFLRPIISPLVPSSFFSLRPPHCIYICVSIHLSPFLHRVSPSVHRSFFFLLA